MKDHRQKNLGKIEYTLLTSILTNVLLKKIETKKIFPALARLTKTRKIWSIINAAETSIRHLNLNRRTICDFVRFLHSTNCNRNHHTEFEIDVTILTRQI